MKTIAKFSQLVSVRVFICTLLFFFSHYINFSLDNDAIAVVLGLIIVLIPFILFNLIILYSLNIGINKSSFWFLSFLFYTGAIIPITIGYFFYFTFIIYGGLASIGYIKLIETYDPESKPDLIVFVIIAFLYPFLDVLLLSLHRTLAQQLMWDDDYKFLIVGRLIIWQIYTAIFTDIIFGKSKEVLEEKKEELSEESTMITKKGSFTIISNLILLYGIFILIFLFSNLICKKYNVALDLNTNIFNSILLLLVEVLPFIVFNIIVNKALKLKKALLPFWLLSILMYILSLILLAFMAWGADSENIIFWGKYLFSITYLVFSAAMTIMYVQTINQTYNYTLRKFVLYFVTLIFFGLASFLINSPIHLLSYFNIDNNLFVAVVLLATWQLYTGILLNCIFNRKYKFFIK